MLSFTLFDLLAKHIPSRESHPALVDGAQQLSYGELHQRALALAAWLAERDARPGDRIGIYMPTCFEQVIAMFAVAYCGAVFVNLCDSWPVPQVEHYANDCAMKGLIVEERRARELFARNLPASIQWVLVKGTAPGNAKAHEWAQIEPRPTLPRARVIDVSLATILYTSGSTGLPKGVMHSHRTLVQATRIAARQLQSSADDRVCCTPLFCSSYGLVQLTGAFLVGATFVVQRTSMITTLVKVLTEQRVTGLAAVPATWVLLTRHLHEQPTLLPHLRYVTNSGGVIPRATLEAMPEVLPGAAIHLIYGSTESCRATVLPPQDFRRKMGSMGLPALNTEIYVVNERGVCGPNEPGELIVRSGTLSIGYWGQPQASAEKFKVCPQLKHLIGDEIVCYTGDVVRLDEEGYLWYIGRRDSLIKSSAASISPTEVEEWLLRNDVVEDAVAFGYPDELRGQVVHVAFSTRNQQVADTAALERHCRVHMPAYMVPVKFHHWQGSMPRLANGKLDRVSIIERFGGGST